MTNTDESSVDTCSSNELSVFCVFQLRQGLTDLWQDFASCVANPLPGSDKPIRSHGLDKIDHVRNRAAFVGLMCEKSIPAFRRLMVDPQRLISMRNAAKVNDLDRMAVDFLDCVTEIDSIIPKLSEIPPERQKAVAKAVLREVAEWMKLPEESQELSWIGALMLLPPPISAGSPIEVANVWQELPPKPKKTVDGFNGRIEQGQNGEISKAVCAQITEICDGVRFFMGCLDDSLEAESQCEYDKVLTHAKDILLDLNLDIKTLMGECRDTPDLMENLSGILRSTVLLKDVLETLTFESRSANQSNILVCLDSLEGWSDLLAEGIETQTTYISARSAKVETSPCELQSIVDRYRFAASEFRDIRTMPDGQQSNLLSRKITDLNGLTQSAWKNGGLLSIDGLVGESEIENLRSFFMFSELVGYTELQSCADLPDEYFLCPGLLSKYSSVFQTIHVGNKSDIDIEDVGCAWEQHRFEILGYYSHACEVIAKILESEVAESCGVDVGAVRLELPPMPNGRNPQRLIQCFWREADWKVMPPRCTARTICREIWPEESNTDIEFLVGSRLKKTLSDTNSKLCEMNVRITFRKCGDYIEMDDYRE